MKTLVVITKILFLLACLSVVMSAILTVELGGGFSWIVFFNLGLLFYNRSVIKNLEKEVKNHETSLD